MFALKSISHEILSLLHFKESNFNPRFASHVSSWTKRAQLSTTIVDREISAIKYVNLVLKIRASGSAKYPEIWIIPRSLRQVLWISISPCFVRLTFPKMPIFYARVSDDPQPSVWHPLPLLHIIQLSHLEQLTRARVRLQLCRCRNLPSNNPTLVKG